MNFFIRKDCRLCNSINLKSALKLEATPPANAFIDENELSTRQEKYPLELFLCSDCSHLQLTTVVSPKVIWKLRLCFRNPPVFIKHFENYSNSIITKYSPDKNKLILDIGSNDGTFLKFFKDMVTKYLVLTLQYQYLKKPKKV